MGYENKAFPLVSGSAYNHYNQRGVEDGVVSGGELPSTGTEYQKTVYVTGEDFAAGDSYTTNLILPKGAQVTSTSFEVNEAFALGGTTPVIDVGVATTEGTNRLVSVSEAQAEAVDTVATDSTPEGTLASVLTADTAIGVALGGTSPTVTSAGRIKVVVTYTKL